MLSVFEASIYLGLSPFSIRKLAREGRIPGGRVGRLWRFNREDLDSFLRQQYGGTASA